MLNIIRNIKSTVATAVASREEGQGTFEWILLVGVVVVAIILAAETGFTTSGMVQDVINDLEAAITTLI